MRKSRYVIAAVAAGLIAAIAAAAVTVPGADARPARSAAETISGAGATFPAPLIAVWQQEYKGGTVNYNPIGSGGGIAAITGRTVDFGASDAPLTPDQFAACQGCVQIPWVLSATAVLYNLPGVKNNIHLSGRVIADMFLGNITKWNDPKITKLNKGVDLPGTDITPVFRSDGSGTNYNFTDYLSQVDQEFKSKVGFGTSVNWPKGVGGRGSSGLAGIVTRTPGAIGYADVAYALKNKIQFAAVQNKSGKYALPGLRGITSASLADKKFSSTNELSIVNPPRGKLFTNAYPICTYSYVILPLKTSKASALKQFVSWAITDGQKFGPKLIFKEIPGYVLTRDKAQLKRVTA
jgi:phosphate transport system substrate-binding protein